ncbi:MAG TPA: FG-GAP-like repeat-containing protein [Verrucomicrobiae bacterium]|nr:FG-GAP-like repeat-containing protein [Verrucomicrobiae bacterium]
MSIQRFFSGAIFFSLLVGALLFQSAAYAEDPLLRVGQFPLRDGSGAWGDYDNDGYLDLAVTGVPASGIPTSQIWHNNGDGTFSNSFTLGPHWAGDLQWVDLDNDGYLDAVVTGNTSATATAVTTVLWRNLGGTNFEEIPTSLPASKYSTITIGDFDNDGRPDIVVFGSANAAAGRIFRNLGSFVFSTNDLPGFVSTGAGTTTYSELARFADVDNDGWLDLLTGRGDLGNSIIYRNLGSSNLTTFATLQNFISSRGDFADYDNDGRLDIFMANRTIGSASSAAVWYNTGSGFVTNSTHFPIGNAPAPATSWADFDNDGLSDVFLAWGNYSGTELCRNLGNGSFAALNFTNESNASFISGDPDNRDLMFGVWGDYDNDGKLDLLRSDSDVKVNFSAVCGLYHNETALSNTPPSAPSGLTFELAAGGTNVTLRWLAASDAETPAAGLSYNIRVGTTPGGCDVVSPMADAVTGLRRVAGLGNAQERLFSYLRNLQPGRTYYWSVQAIDSGYAGGSWSSEASFTTQARPQGDLNGDGIVSASELNQVINSYLATSPYLQITNSIGLGSNVVSFALTNDFAGAFTVEYSTNLTDWQPLGPATPRYQFTDPDASSNPQRFYRLRWP